jgi:hypothetical protein
MIIREWTPPALLLWLFVVVTFPFWGTLVAVIWLDDNCRKVKRRFLGPRVGEWQRWFAWFPVALDNGWGPTVWLEPVERTSIGSSYHWGIVYRPANPIPHQENTQ